MIITLNMRKAAMQILHILLPSTSPRQKLMKYLQKKKTVDI